MPIELANLLNSAKNWWKSLQPGQKTGLMITGLIAALLGGGIFYWAATPEYKPLFTNLSDTDSAKIVKKLEDDKVISFNFDGRNYVNLRLVIDEVNSWDEN